MLIEVDTVLSEVEAADSDGVIDAERLATEFDTLPSEVEMLARL